MNQLELKKEKLRLLKLKEVALARENFYSFCVYMDSSFFTKGKPHLKLIADSLQDIYEGKIQKLSVSVPPRYGKSYTITLYNSWIYGKIPSIAIMRNSYTAELAETFSYKTREILKSEKYLKVFPNIELKKDRQNISDWSLTTAKQTSYFCAGVGGSITGKGANILELDDGIKGVEEALSETIVSKTWNWYIGDHMARREIGYKNILIGTRYCKNDPIGKLTDPESEYFDREFRVIIIPALDENGKSTCEEIMPTEEYKWIKDKMDNFIWESVYMQQPISEKGLLYPIAELNKFSLKDIATKKPDAIVGFTDVADKGSDFLCSVSGLVFGEFIYINDVVFTQDGVEITEPLVADMIIRNKMDTMHIESNNGGYGFSRNVRDLIRNKSYCSIMAETTTTNKETRIIMNAGYIKQYFYFRDDYEAGSDYDKYMRQLTSYIKLGKNKHDDAADSTTGLAERMKYKTFTKPTEKKKSTLWMFNDKQVESNGVIDW